MSSSTVIIAIIMLAVPLGAVIHGAYWNRKYGTKTQATGGDTGGYDGGATPDCVGDGGDCD